MIQKTVLPAVAATSLMTLFSYAAAHYKRKNFSEPELLAKIENKQMHLPKPMALPAGWATHYAVGVLMTLFFNTYKTVTPLNKYFFQTISFGTLGGLAAILAWNKLFKALPERSKQFYRQFYIQLFIAHLIFASVITLTQETREKSR